MLMDQPLSIPKRPTPLPADATIPPAGVGAGDRPDVPATPTPDQPTTDPMALISPGTPVASSPVSDIDPRMQVEELKRELVHTQEERGIIEKELAVTSKEVQMLEKTLVSMDADTKVAREKIDALDKQEHSTSDGMILRKTEEERWSASQWWHELDSRRWTLHESLDTSLHSILTLQERASEVKKKEEQLEVSIRAIEHAERMKLLTEKLNDARAVHESAREQLRVLSIEHKRITANLNEVVVNEQNTEEEEEKIAKRLSVAQSFAEERALGTSRFEIEKKRHEIEEVRWRLEDQARKLGEDIQATQQSLDVAIHALDDIEAEINAEEGAFRGA